MTQRDQMNFEGYRAFLRNLSPRTWEYLTRERQHIRWHERYGLTREQALVVESDMRTPADRR